MGKAKSKPILERLIRPFYDSMDEQSARRWIDYKADRVVQARVAVLAEKCNEGRLTPKEQSEYESIVAVGSIISILKAKARFMLSKKTKSK
jgi:hypothetical protein